MPPYDGEGSMEGARHEIWQCQDGPIKVAVDAQGCPLDSQYCKIQAGSTALGVATAATFLITIAVTNLVFARTRGVLMNASDPAAIPLLNIKDQIGITSIIVLGNEMLSGEVPLSRYLNDTTGPGNVGTAQLYRGDLGTAGGTVAIAGINRSPVAVNIWGSIDITGKKAG